MSGGFSEAASAKSSNVTHHNDTIFTRATERCSEPLIRFLINRSSCVIVVACHVEGNHFTSETSRISHQIMRGELTCEEDLSRIWTQLRVSWLPTCLVLYLLLEPPPTPCSRHDYSLDNNLIQPKWGWGKTIIRKYFLIQTSSWEDFCGCWSYVLYYLWYSQCNLYPRLELIIRIKHFKSRIWQSTSSGFDR